MCWPPGGAAGAVSRITGALGKGIATLTLDEEYQKKRREQLNKRPADLKEGLARGGKGLVMVGGTHTYTTGQGPGHGGWYTHLHYMARAWSWWVVHTPTLQGKGLVQKGYLFEKKHISREMGWDLESYSQVQSVLL